MAKRTKSKTDLIQIETFDQADKLLKRASELQASIDQANNELTAMIDQLKSHTKDTVGPLQLEIDKITKSLQAYCTANKQEFGNAQSKKLNHGKLGWRRSSSITVRNDTLDLIKQLFKPALKKVCIVVKETVSKDALADLTDDQLTDINARRNHKNIFFIEPEKVEIK